MVRIEPTQELSDSPPHRKTAQIPLCSNSTKSLLLQKMQLNQYYISHSIAGHPNNIFINFFNQDYFNF